MSDRRKDRPEGKCIQQCPHQNRHFLLLSLKTEKGKRQACKINSQQNQKRVKLIHPCFLRHKYREKIQRIPVGVIMQRCEKIGSVPDLQIPERNLKPMFHKQSAQNISEPGPVIQKGIKMLRHPVAVPHKRFSIKIKSGKNKSRRAEKAQRIYHKVILF